VKLAFSADGLVPVVAQDRITGEVRMVAYANAEAVRRTFETRKATFFSRSRGEIWEKGATSGNALAVSSVLVDCDADCLLYLVTPEGPSCHTGKPTCFFRRLEADGSVSASSVEATTLLHRLDATLESRQRSTAEQSYVKSLFDGGRATSSASSMVERRRSARSFAKKRTSSRARSPTRVTSV
jgi:phosphoribosyl-AMP cyclohydrolase / phosphoribosyl-ATP pyrophosphohydrolase